MFEFDVKPLIVHHGYWATFAIVMLESAGVPVPGESALVLAAGYAGVTGHLNIYWVIAIAAAGAIVGDNGGYWFGRSVGVRLLDRYGPYIGLTPERLRLSEYLFVRHGGKTVFFGRFIAFLRVFAAQLAGINRYDWGSFLFFNAAGGITWALVIGISAYVFGDAVRRVSGPLGIAGLVAVALGLFIFWLILRRGEKQLEDRLTEKADEAEQQKTSQET